MIVPNNKQLPPGQSVTEKWTVLDLGVRPEIKLKDWTLEISGLVENPITVNWDDFLKLPQTVLTEDFHCVTAWSTLDNKWEGVLLSHLLDKAKSKPEGKFVMQYGYDGYTVNVTAEDLVKDNVILAHKHNSEPLTVEHGGPVRLIIPHLYGWKGSKWIKKIEYRSDDEPGFWELRGYHNRGDFWKEERYS